MEVNTVLFYFLHEYINTFYKHVESMKVRKMASLYIVLPFNTKLLNTLLLCLLHKICYFMITYRF